MLADLRQAVRLLLQAKGWTAVVLLSLALGIGANTALFGVVNGLVFRTVPVRNPETLVRLRWSGDNDVLTNHSGYGSVRSVSGQRTSESFSWPMYQQFIAANQTMSGILACAPFGRVNVVVDGQAEIARAFISSGNYFQLLGVTPAAGRLLDPDDDRADAAAVAVISHGYWRSKFGGERQALGKTIRVNSVPVTIVGVISNGFTGIQQPIAEPPDITVPLGLYSRLAPGQPPLNDSTSWWLQVVGRVKPGVTATQVQANLSTVFQQTAKAGLDAYVVSLTAEARSQSTNVNRSRIPSLVVEPGERGVYDSNLNEVRSVTMLSAVVGLVLLIVCANVANLLLSRATARQKEISVRLSMGATRRRLIRQLLTESLVIATIGGALGVVLGFWIQRLLPDALGRPAPFDLRVAAFALGAIALTGLIFGLAPALTATRVSLSTTLKAEARSVVGSRRLLGKSLLVVQVSLSLVLLVGAGLFLRTIHNLRSVDVGFNPSHLLVFSVNPQLNGYDPPRRLALFRDLHTRLGALPGVRIVGMSQPALLAGSVNNTSIFVHGRSYTRGQRSSDNINRVVASPTFFETMEMPLTSGRGLSDRDTETAPKVVVINEAAARKYFPNASPIGQRFGPSLEDTGQLEVVGVVRDAKYNSLRDAAPPTMYVPFSQTRVGAAAVEIRTAGDPSAAIGAIREVVRQLDPNLPLMNVTTQLEQIENRFQQERVFAQAYTLFGGLALVLASIGLFGLMSYAVARRTNEIGIRMALGAQRSSVLTLVLGESMTLVLIGIALGVATALAAGRFVQAYLFGVPPTDPFSIGGAIAVMLGVSAFAAYLPARRASRVSPLVALRAE